jgi:DNA-binding CsgD family transcriptional regulator
VMSASGALAQMRGAGEVRLSEGRSAVTALRAAKEAGARGHAAALALYRGLVCGELSVVEKREAGRPEYWFLENAPHRRPLSALTAGEESVLSMLCQGRLASEIAYALGITPGAVSFRLRRATEKLALASRFDLLRIAAMIVRDPRAESSKAELTQAEAEILEMLAAGLSNGAIAAARSTSIRTVANQVAAVLRKTGASGRRALAGFRRESAEEADALTVGGSHSSESARTDIRSLP